MKKNACPRVTRGEYSQYITERKYRMKKVVIFEKIRWDKNIYLTERILFYKIVKRNGFTPYSFTQAGCSFLFLLPGNHTDIFYHLNHDGPTFLQKRCCIGKFLHICHHILEGQNEHHTDTSQT